MLLRNKYDLKKPKDFRVSKGHKYPHVYIYIYKNELCLLFPNFKLASNQTKIQKFLKIIFITKYIRKTRIFLKKKKENK
jgi:hypothetical protein